MGIENPQLSCHLYLTRTLSMSIVPYRVISMALALLFMAGYNNSGCLLGTGGKVHLEETYVGTISFIMSDIDVGGLCRCIGSRKGSDLMDHSP